MSKKRGFEQISEIGGVCLFPATKRRKIWNEPIGKAEKEHKEEEFEQLRYCMDLDNESITSVVESVDSLESDMEFECINNNDKQNEKQCNELLCKLQYNPQFLIPSNHFTQTICIFGGNYKILKLILSDITNNLVQIINDYNFKLQLINTNININNENKTKLINTMVAQQLLQNKNFTKIQYEDNATMDIISTYQNCDICIVFPDNNINILCQIINFINSPKKSNNIQNNIQNRLNIIEQNKRLFLGAYKKRILLVNIAGFFNGLRLQIMNFNNTKDLPNPTNIVFVDEFNDTIKQLKQWSK